jgi:hypothetical protein
MSLTALSQNALCIVYQAASSLKPGTPNPRTHSKKQIGQIANAIRGLQTPCVDDANGIVTGHGRKLPKPFAWARFRRYACRL